MLLGLSFSTMLCDQLPTSVESDGQIQEGSDSGAFFFFFIFPYNVAAQLLLGLLLLP